MPVLGRGLGFLSFSPCGRLLAIVGDVITILDAKTRDTIVEIPIEFGTEVAFSPNGSLMAVGSSSAGEVFDTTRFLNGTRR